MSPKISPNDIILMMKKIFIHFICLITLFFTFADRAEAIKIGLQSDMAEVATGLSVRGTISEKNTGRIICTLEPMQTYIFKAQKLAYKQLCNYNCSCNRRFCLCKKQMVQRQNHNRKQKQIFNGYK